MMLKEYKSITEIVGPLMLVEGVNGVKYDELVEITARDSSIRLGKEIGRASCRERVCEYV